MEPCAYAANVEHQENTNGARDGPVWLVVVGDQPLLLELLVRHMKVGNLPQDVARKHRYGLINEPTCTASVFFLNAYIVQQ